MAAMLDTGLAADCTDLVVAPGRGATVADVRDVLPLLTAALRAPSASR
jgi:hypothetical protein